MRVLLKRLGLMLAILCVAIQLYRPERSNPPVDRPRAIQAHLEVSPAAARVLDRSCRDCHTQETRWPWYSNVAPASWFVANHVNHARSHLNLSDWAAYSPEDVRHHLEEMCQLVRKGEMPLPSYLWIHRHARPSSEDVQALCDWTQAAVRQLVERAVSASTEGVGEGGTPRRAPGPQLPASALPPGGMP